VKLGEDYLPRLFFGLQDEAKEACGINQLCAGLEAGIEGGIMRRRKCGMLSQ
jgi:hypothetical protein